MGFRLVPKSVTLNDPEWRNPLSLHYSTEFDRFGTNHVKVVKDIPYYLQ